MSAAFPVSTRACTDASAMSPMMSLRDIDEAGHFELARKFGGQRRLSFDEQDRILENSLKVVRRQRGRVAELDPNESNED